MRYRVTSLFNDKAVPVSLVPTIELFFDLTCDVRKVAWVLILKSLEASYYGDLLLLLSHVGSLNKHLAISVCPKRV